MADRIFLSHPASLLHDTGPHPECAARIVAIEERLEHDGWYGFERVVAALKQGAVDARGLDALEAVPAVALQALLDCDHPRCAFGVRSSVVKQRGGMAEEDAIRHRCTVPRECRTAQ